MSDPSGIPTIASLAQNAGVHPTRLSTQFRMWFGVSPGEVVRQRRVELAVDLIQRTALPLVEIAQRASTTTRVIPPTKSGEGPPDSCLFPKGPPFGA